jgi:hypothetical protein
MSQIPLEDLPYEFIKAHLLDPENSPLPIRYRQKLNRAVSIFKLLDKHPVDSNAIKFHRILYPEISKVTAWKDLRFAKMMFSSYQDFSFEFWDSWFISDVIENIIKCRKENSSADRKIIAREHANLARFLDKKPKPEDPVRKEPHSYYIMVDLTKKRIKHDMDNLHKLPLSTIQDLKDALSSLNEIDVQDATETMNI